MLELLKSASPGAKGIMSDSGWSNTTICRKYHKDHFLSFIRPDD